MTDINKFLNVPLKRRGFLKIAGLSAVAAPFTGRIAWGQQSDFDLFMKLSQYLTGRTTLDRQLGQRIFTTLASLDSTFTARMKELDMYVDSNILSVDTLQQDLEQGKRDLADIPRLILDSWYLGVVRGQTCVAYESALMFTPVHDTLVLPSHSSNQFGYWKNKPEVE